MVGYLCSSLFLSPFTCGWLLLFLSLSVTLCPSVNILRRIYRLAFNYLELSIRKRIWQWTMNICCVLVILAQCRALFAYNVWVERRRTSDFFAPLTQCADECKKRNGRCSKSKNQCCERCTCDNGKTFFEESGTQSCVKNVGHNESK